MKKAIPVFFIASGLVLYYFVQFDPVGVDRELINDLVTAPNEQIQNSFKNGLAMGFIICGAITSFLFWEKSRT